jgi:hypothetical protein
MVATVASVAGGRRLERRDVILAVLIVGSFCVLSVRNQITLYDLMRLVEGRPLPVGRSVVVAVSWLLAFVHILLWGLYALAIVAVARLGFVDARQLTFQPAYSAVGLAQVMLLVWAVATFLLLQMVPRTVPDVARAFVWMALFKRVAYLLSACVLIALLRRRFALGWWAGLYCVATPLVVFLVVNVVFTNLIPLLAPAR